MQSQPASQPVTFTCRRYGVTMMAETADEFCMDQIRRALVPRLAESRKHCLDDCDRGYRLKEDAMKKTCKKHGEFETGSNRGSCPKCKTEGGVTAKKKVSGPRTPLPPPKATALPSGRNDITIDLSARPEIAMRIHQMAQENFRTIDMQVLYMLHSEYERSGGK